MQQQAVRNLTDDVSSPTEDFTVVDVIEGSVVLETNEWRDDSRCHHVSTLRFRPEEARLLAAMLARHAENADF